MGDAYNESQMSQFDEKLCRVLDQLNCCFMMAANSTHCNPMIKAMIVPGNVLPQRCCQILPELNSTRVQPPHQ